MDVFEQMEKNSKKALEKVQALQYDIAVKMQEDEESSEESEIENQDNQIISGKTVQTLTRLRSSVEEVNKAKENPMKTFINDSLNDMLSLIVGSK